MNMIFTISTYTEVDSSFPKPISEHYDYWIPLINYFLVKSDAIEIQCWNEEV